MKIENQQLREFNSSKKNQKRIESSKGYTFVSCPDFSHCDGKYNFKSISNGLPLSFSLFMNCIKEKKLDKDVYILLSDHEAERLEVCDNVSLSQNEMLQKMSGSLASMRRFTSNVEVLSNYYRYEEVQERKRFVPEDSHMQSIVYSWLESGESEKVLIDRYKEKYAQMYCFLNLCKEMNWTAVFLYSNLMIRIVSVVRKEVSVGILFLDTLDPH